MKKIICCILAAVLVAGSVFTVVAAERTRCDISADHVTAGTDSLVTVAVRISGNPGFTNFGIALDYDRDALTLVSISAADGICGELVSVNTAWDPASAEGSPLKAGKTCGYVSCACPEAVTGNGILFTATFRVSPTASGTAEVTPVVVYLRNNTAVLSVFESISAAVSGGSVTYTLVGDYDGDGILEAADAEGLYNAIKVGRIFTQAEISLYDKTGDGRIDVLDVAAVYSAANQK